MRVDCAAGTQGVAHALAVGSARRAERVRLQASSLPLLLSSAAMQATACPVRRRPSGFRGGGPRRGRPGRRQEDWRRRAASEALPAREGVACCHEQAHKRGNEAGPCPVRAHAIRSDEDCLWTTQGQVRAAGAASNSTSSLRRTARRSLRRIQARPGRHGGGRHNGSRARQRGGSDQRPTEQLSAGWAICRHCCCCWRHPRLAERRMGHIVGDEGEHAVACVCPGPATALRTMCPRLGGLWPGHARQPRQWRSIRAGFATRS